MKKRYPQRIIHLLILFLLSTIISQAQITVNTLAELRTAIISNDQEIIMTPGNYNFEDLDADKDNRDLLFSGSNNTVTLTGVYVEVPVGSVDDVYIEVSGNNNTIIDGEFEDTYNNGLTEITDFSAYNQDRDYLAHGLGGDPVMKISGQGNLVDGIKLTVRGSFPYGYGSMYGINQVNTFGLNKRCGLLINGPQNTLDNVEVQQRAFGHAIFMQGDADETVIKNTYVEGRTRPTGDLYYETNSYDLPFLSGYKYPYEDNRPFIVGEVHSLTEDGIRQYNGVGSVTVENCTVKGTRGGFRLYLGGQAIVKNCTATDCGATNYNLSSNAVVENSYGNFTNGPLRDNRLNRGGITATWTIIPSPNSGAEHNIADVLGGNQNLTFLRTDGPLDDKEKKAIVVVGDNSTIVNETEYTIVLDAEASGNNVTSCGPVIDNGSGNTITINTCDFVITCNNTASNLEAECYDNMNGVQTEAININNDAIANINNGDWISFSAIDLSDMGIVKAIVSSPVDGASIEVRTESNTGNLIGTIQVPNTSDFNTYEEIAVELDQSFDGFTNLFFVFKGADGSLLNLDEISFEENACTETLDPTPPIQLEDYCEASDVRLNYLVNDNQEVNFINDGDYLKFANVDFDLVEFNSVDFAASSSTNGGTVELRIGAIDGTLLSSIEITNTGGWDQYEIFNNYSLTDVTGIQDLFVVFKGADGYLFNADYLYFRNDPCLTIVDAFGQTSALDHCEKSGVVAINNEYLGGIHDGDWIRYGSIDFGSVSPSEVIVNVSGLSSTDGVVSILLNDPTTGTLIATATVPATNGWENWEDVTVPVDVEVTGIQDVYIYFSGGSYNLNWFQFYKDPCDGSFVKDATQIEAEDFCEMSNVAIENSANNVTDIGSIKNGSWVKYSNYDLTDMKSIEASVTTSTVGGAIEVRLDDENGEVLTTLDVSTTGGWDNWELVNSNIANITGVHDIFITFTGGTNYLFNIDWFSFSEQEVIITNVTDHTFSDMSIYPNPTSGVTHFSSNSTYELINTLGATVLSGEGTEVDLTELAQGIYFLKMDYEEQSRIVKILKK